MRTLGRSATAAVLLVAAASAAGAAPGVEFRISGMDPASVMRFSDPADPSNLRIGYIQSTQFSHSVGGPRKTAGTIEDGILYYTVQLKKIGDGRFELTLAYDFASSDGRSRGIRSRSEVTEALLRGITERETEERAGRHAAEFSEVIFENFLKERIDPAELPNLRKFLEELVRALLKPMPKDAIMIIRRWDDLAGRDAAGGGKS